MAVIFGSGTVPEAGRRNLVSLDGLRGIAVLAVMFSHFNRFLPAIPAFVPMKVLFTYGWSGVDLFFVLSGFLITGILTQTKSAANYFQSFYIRRFLRIFPIYYAALIVIFAVIALMPSIPNVPPPSERWTYFLYIDNWLPFWTGVWPPNVVGHFWSLAVEEQFYVLWPFVVFLVSERFLWRLIPVLITAALVLRITLATHGVPSEAIMLGTFTRMDSLLIGALGALLYKKLSQWQAPRALPWIAGGCLALFALGTWLFDWKSLEIQNFGFTETIGYSLLAIAFGAIVLACAINDDRKSAVQRFLHLKPLGLVGRYSYGMYVYHVPFLGICELLILRHIPIAVAGTWWFSACYVIFLALGTYGISLVSYEFFERRILMLKKFVAPTFTSAIAYSKE